MNRLQRAACVSIALLVLAPALVTGSSAHATRTTAPDYAAIDRYVEDQMDDSRIPGVAIALVEGDQIVHQRGFGTAGNNRDVTPQTPFPVGSLIKSFTALAVMQLVAAGQIELDAPVQRYLPWFRVADADASAQITVRHLLNQTSGLSRETGIKPLYKGGDATLTQLVRDLSGEELNRPVGASYEYSNANFTTAALIVETVSGEPFGDYLNRHILAPLGMRQSSATGDPVPSGLTALYRYWFGVPVSVGDAFRPSQFQGEYLIASAEDMAHYLSMYLGGGGYGGATVLATDGIAEMLTPATNETTRQLLSTDFTFRYGMGWFAGAFGAATDARWHLGELPYFNAWMVLLPESNRGVVVLINAGSQLEFADANEVMSRIPIGIVDLLEGASPPTGTSTTQFYLFFNIAVLIIAVVQLRALVRLVRRPLAVAFPPHGLHATALLALRTLPLLWEVGLGLGVLLGYPALLGMSVRGSFLAFPDLTLVLITVATLWIITGIVRGVRIGQLLRDRRTTTGHTERRLTVQPITVR